MSLDTSLLSSEPQFPVSEIEDVDWWVPWGLSEVSGDMHSEVSSSCSQKQRRSRAATVHVCQMAML